MKAFTSIARRIAALVLLRDRLDANYIAAAGTTVTIPAALVLPPGAAGLGDRILFGKYSGTSVRIDSDELLLLREDDILSVIEGRPATTDVPATTKPTPGGKNPASPQPTSAIDPQAALLNDPRNVPLWFGTNREPNDRTRIDRGFGGQRSAEGVVWHGRCTVNVPEGHSLGSTGTEGLKGWWQRWAHGVDDRLRLLSVEGLDEPGFWQAVRAAMDEPDRHKPEALLFVHGYRVTFADAALRAAQLAYDLKIRDASFFAWPSAGAAAKYTVDV